MTKQVSFNQITNSSDKSSKALHLEKSIKIAPIKNATVYNWGSGEKLVAGIERDAWSVKKRTTIVSKHEFENVRAPIY